MKNKTREKLAVIIGGIDVSLALICRFEYLFTKDTTWMLMCMICAGGMALSSVLLGSIRNNIAIKEIEERLKK